MEKSFGEILTEAVEVFKKTAPDLLKILGVWLGGFIIVATALLTTVGMDFIKNVNDSQYVQNYLAASSVNLGLVVGGIFLFLFVLSYVCYCCGILVIRNYLVGIKDALKETFFKSFGKFCKLFFALLLMGIVYFIIIAAGIALPFFIIPSQYAIFTLFVIIPVVLLSIVLFTPFSFTVFYGMLCLETSFSNILSDSIRLGFKRFFKIIAYMFLISLICGLPVSMILSILTYVFHALHLEVIGHIVAFAGQIAVGFFSACFLTIFYLDIAGLTGATVEEITMDQNPQ